MIVEPDPRQATKTKQPKSVAWPIIKWTLSMTLMVAIMISTPVSALAGVANNIAMGDKAWSLRAEGHRESLAELEPIQKAIDAYTAALDEEPDNLEARWKLLRALHFKGEFVLENRDDRRILFKHGREIAEAGTLQVERQYGLNKNMFKMKPADVAKAIGKNTPIAELCFWSSASWGLWGQYSGIMAAIRKGVVKKIRSFAEIMILLDDQVEKGGGHRLLGRLHTRVPKIPLFTGWVNRDLSISELRLSLEIAPDDLLSKYYLAEALLKYRTSEKQEAMDILQDIVKSQPDAGRLVEDTRTIEDAGKLLTKPDG